jgi:hypothetical protein
MDIEVTRWARECPREYSDFLVRIGGLNVHGQPQFRLVWGQSSTKNIWGQMDGGSCGKHEVLRYGGVAAWHLEEWKPPAYFGSPEDWYAKSWDANTGLHTQGDYPFRGDYICQIQLYTRRFEGDKMIIDALPLNYEILELLVPAIFESRSLTYSEVKYRTEQELAKQKQEFKNKSIDAYKNAQIPFHGNDWTGASNRERMIDKHKARHFPISAEEIKKRMGTGHQAVQI